MFVEGLHSEGFDAITAPGSGPGVQRVLVGPVKGPDIAAIRARLDARGVHAFIRRYSEAPAPLAQPNTEPQKTATPEATP